MKNEIVAIQGNNLKQLNPKTDTSIFLALEAQKRKYKIFYYEPINIYIENNKVLAKGNFVKFNHSNKDFYKIEKKRIINLSTVQYILIRQDPPFNMEYITTTYILEKINLFINFFEITFPLLQLFLLQFFASIILEYIE